MTERTSPNTFDLASVDYAGITNSLRAFLESKASEKTLSDYNFAGSNMSLLIDLLAYNTHYMAVYLNMVANEIYLDSAARRESVVSRAKELSYLPRSRRASSVRVNVEVRIGLDQGYEEGDTLTLARWTPVQALNYSRESTSLQFLVVEPVSTTFEADGGDLVATFENVLLKAGIRLSDTYTVDITDPNQRFLIRNSQVDTTTLAVTVRNSRTDTTETTYTLNTNFTTIDDTSDVYFLQELVDGKYEVTFGDGTFGTQVINGNVVVLEYIAVPGDTEDAVDATNGVSRFGTMTVDGIAGGVVTLYDPVDGRSAGGTERESIESIRRNAPYWYAAQYRAVSAPDYAAKLLNDFPTIQSINVWGGEDNDPPQYGRVYICVKPKRGKKLTPSQKREITDRILNNYRVVTVDPVVVDPSFLYLHVTSDIRFDSRKTTLADLELANLIRAEILNFATDNLSTFDNDFEYSRLVTTIDETDRCILNNLTVVRLGSEFIPNIGSKYSTTVSFGGNPIARNSTASIGNLTSTKFTIGTKICTFEDDPSTKTLRIISTTTGSRVVINDDAGTVDYENGKVSIDQVTFAAFQGTAVRIIVTPAVENLFANQNQLLLIEDSDIVLRFNDKADD